MPGIDAKMRNSNMHYYERNYKPSIIKTKGGKIMGTLGWLRILGAGAKIVGGLAGAGIGFIEMRDILGSSAPAIPETSNEPDLSIVVDCGDGFKEVETTE